MPPRLFVDRPLRTDASFSLPAGATRHVQVLRLQPGSPLTLFDGGGGEWSASVLRIGRSAVEVQVGGHVEVDRELPFDVVLAVGMPANERMDALIEKATELGVRAVQPLLCERSVLRLAGERAAKKVAHWRGVAVAASEQSGRTRVPEIAPVRPLADWLGGLPAPGHGQTRWLLGFEAAEPLVGRIAAREHGAVVLSLSGPEGGLAPAEEARARSVGFAVVSLGPRVLRADTAPIALLARLALA